MHFKYENLKNYAPTNIAYCSFERLGVPLFVGANFIMSKIEHYKNLSLENLTDYDNDGNLVIETWKDIHSYENIYQSSTFGRTKSLERISKQNNRLKEKILKTNLDKDGYVCVPIFRVGYKRNKRVNILVGQTFIPNPLNKPQVNHIDRVKTNNCVWNLEWNTARENNIHRSLNKLSSSKYTGVYWKKSRKAWESYIHFDGKSVFLGYFKEEIDAHNAYQKALSEINNGTFVLPTKKRKTSQYKGVYWKKSEEKWGATYTYNKKQIHVGYFKTELEAYETLQAKLKELSC